MINCALCGPLSRLGMGLLFPGKQVAPVGSAPPQASETLPGNPSLALGVTVAVKVAGTPAGTVAEAGATLRLKSFTLTLAESVSSTDPLTPTAPLFPRVTLFPGKVGAVGVTLTVTVAVAAAFIAPILHSTTCCVWF